MTEKIGQGGFSKVYKCFDVDYPEVPLALKLLKSMTNKEMEAKVLEEEIKNLEFMDHHGIVKILDYSINKKMTKYPGGAFKHASYIIMELAENGELFDWVQETGAYSEKLARFYFSKILEILEHLHNKGVAHMDIKPENLLYDSEFNIKLADFGFATTKSISTSRKGTDAYMLPEL